MVRLISLLALVLWATSASAQGTLTPGTNNEPSDGTKPPSPPFAHGPIAPTTPSVTTPGFHSSSGRVQKRGTPSLIGPRDTVSLPDGFRTGAIPPAYAGQISYADQMRQAFTNGVIRLQKGETRMQPIPSVTASRRTFDSDLNAVEAHSDPCTTLPGVDIVATPGGLVSTRRVGNSIKVHALNKGKGELWMRGRVQCRKRDGSRYEAHTIAIHILLIGDAAIADFDDRTRPEPGTLANTPQGDIARAVVSGKARISDTGEPVADGVITLVSLDGTEITDPRWRTRPNGSFSIEVRQDKNLRSGRYEVLIQKLDQGPVPGRCNPRTGTTASIGNNCDLWPVRKYFVELSRDRPRVDAGTVGMNFARNINFANRNAGKTTVGRLKDFLRLLPRAEQAK